MTVDLDPTIGTDFPPDGTAGAHLVRHQAVEAAVVALKTAVDALQVDLDANGAQDVADAAAATAALLAEQTARAAADAQDVTDDAAEVTARAAAVSAEAALRAAETTRAQLAEGNVASAANTALTSAVSTLNTALTLKADSTTVTSQIAALSGTYMPTYVVKADLSNLQSQVTAACTTGGIVQILAGTVTLPAIVAVPSDLTRRIKIRGMGVDSTTIVLTSTVNQFVQMQRTAAGSVLRNVTLEDLTVDASALTSDTTSANVPGAIFGASNASDTSWADINISRVRGIGGPINTNVSNQFRWIYVGSNTNTGATLCTIRRILLEDFDLTGGETGVYIGAGRLQTGAADAPNVFLTDITCRRGRHVLPLPTGFLVSNNFIFGHRGRGGRLRVNDLYGYGCGDAGLEVDCWDDAVVEACTVEDAWNSCFYHTHYNASLTPSAQRITYRDCTAKRTSFIPSAFTAGVGQGYGWYQSGGISSIAPAPTVLQRCSFIKTTPDLSVEGAALISYSSRGIVLDDFTSDESGVAYDTNSAASSAIHIRSSTGVTVPVTLRGLRVSVAGAKNTGTDRQWSAVRFQFGGYTLTLDDIAVTYNVSGSPGATTVRAIWLGDDNVATVIKGSARKVRFLACTDSSAWLFAVGPLALTTFQPKMVIEDCDVRLPGDTNATTVGRTLVFFRGAGGNQANTGLVLVRNSAPAGKFPVVRGTITLGASPFTYQNLDGVTERVVIGGGAISSVALSQDNSEFFELGTTTTLVRLEPGEFVRVTYTGTPTLFKLYDR